MQQDDFVILGTGRADFSRSEFTDPLDVHGLSVGVSGPEFLIHAVEGTVEVACLWVDGEQRKRTGGAHADTCWNTANPSCLLEIHLPLEGKN